MEEREKRQDTGWKTRVPRWEWSDFPKTARGQAGKQVWEGAQTLSRVRCRCVGHDLVDGCGSLPVLLVLPTTPAPSIVADVPAEERLSAVCRRGEEICHTTRAVGRGHSGRGCRTRRASHASARSPTSQCSAGSAPGSVRGTTTASVASHYTIHHASAVLRAVV